MGLSDEKCASWWLESCASVPRQSPSSLVKHRFRPFVSVFQTPKITAEIQTGDQHSDGTQGNQHPPRDNSIDGGAGKHHQPLNIPSEHTLQLPSAKAANPHAAIG
jgi:hypothetical protein